MIVITGGAGFIGSSIVWELNTRGRSDILIVDDLKKAEKWKNINGLIFDDIMSRTTFYEKVQNDSLRFVPEAVIHMGACSSTTETDADYLLENNFRYSKALANLCVKKKIRFIYASSAATYGDGAEGYADDLSQIRRLRPLNMYGYSKHLFDLWLQRNNMLGSAVGIKFFNVFGPNEYHKGEMRSVIHKAYEQIHNTGKASLFKSYKTEYKDGEQMRDFIYVKDAVKMTLFFLANPEINGIYNVGTGKARSWNDLVKAIFNAMDKPVNIEYIEMPEYLKPKYQYYTEADNSKIISAGYKEPIATLEDSVRDYVRNYLMADMYLGY